MERPLDEQTYQALKDELVKQWYQALQDEDCVRIMKLLKEEPSLLQKGWKSETSQERTGSEWKGRSVFHVAARRGCVELIIRALKACRFVDMVPEYEKTNCAMLFKRGLKLYNFQDNFRCFPKPVELGISLSPKRRDHNSAFRSIGHDPHFFWPDEQGTGAISSPKSVEITAAPPDQSDLSSLKSVVATVARPDQSNQSQSEGDDESDESDDSGESDESDESDEKSAGSSRHGSESEQQPMRESSQIALKTNSADADRFKMKLLKAVTTGRRESPQTGLKTSSAHAGRAMMRLQTAVAAVARSSKIVARWRHKEHNLQKSAVPSSPAEHPLLVQPQKDHGGKPDKPAGQSISREDLSRILFSKDGFYELDALALGTLSYNKDLMDLLLYAIITCEPNVFWIRKRNPRALIRGDKAHEENKSWLRDATGQVIEMFKKTEPALVSACLDEYLKHPDFNFLAIHEYLFHFSFTSRCKQAEAASQNKQSDPRFDNIRAVLWDHIGSFQLLRPDLRRFLSEFRDGLGRPPIHVAADEKTSPDFFWLKTDDSSAVVNALLARDGNGRLVVHRFSDSESIKLFTRVLGHFLPKSNLSDRFQYQSEYQGWQDYDKKHGMNVEVLSRLNGFRGGQHESGPPFAAIIDSKFDIYLTTKVLSNGTKRILRTSLSYVYPDQDLSSLGYHTEQRLEEIDVTPHSYDSVRWQDYEEATSRLSDIELACLLGNNPDMIHHMLSNKGAAEDLKLIYNENGCHALHIVAASGNYKVLKALIDSPHCDPFIVDKEGNNALHYTLREPIFTFKSHLLDFVSFQQFLAKDDRKLEKDVLEKNVLAERQGCVNLLLQTGCDVFKVNKKGQGPYPQGRLGNNGEFLSWWYTVQTKEFAATQNNLNTAANAISITATLVATASYVGPLQPPTGYDDANQIHYQNGWVATFLFCDTLSFYLAIAAIILSLIPSLPVPQQAMRDELRRTERMVTLAVGILFPSIVCVLIAFASSSMAVVSAKVITSSIGGKLTIASMFIGAPAIFVAFCLFTIRLLGIWFPRNSYIRYLHKLTSF